MPWVKLKQRNLKVSLSANILLTSISFIQVYDIISLDFYAFQMTKKKTYVQSQVSNQS